MTGMTEVPASNGGLRERKKARTRAAIREHALRLFREQGYGATTIEQISAAAEVSPATFFRYFPTKEDVVLQDDFDVVTLEALEAQPRDLSPIAAFRGAAAAARAQMSADDVARFAETTRLTLSVPEIRARALDELIRTTDVITAAIAARTDRSPDDFAARNLAGAIIGVIMTATMPWHALRDGGTDVDEMFDRIDAGLAHLEAGLPLSAPGRP
jgi:AcrR family transcriptional regulator